MAFLRAKGIRLLCIKEGDHNGIENDVIYYQYIDGHYKNFETVVRSVFQYLNQAVPDVDIEKFKLEHTPPPEQMKIST